MSKRKNDEKKQLSFIRFRETPKLLQKKLLRGLVSI